MPVRGTAGKGDLFVRFSVRFPTHPLASEASKMLKQILPRSVASGGAGPPPKGARVYHLETVDDGSEAGAGDGGEWGF